MTERGYEATAGAGTELTRPFRHDSIYMYPNLVKRDGPGGAFNVNTVTTRGGAVELIDSRFGGTSCPNSCTSAQRWSCFEWRRRISTDVYRIGFVCL